MLTTGLEGADAGPVWPEEPPPGLEDPASEEALLAAGPTYPVGPLPTNSAFAVAVVKLPVPVAVNPLVPSTVYVTL